MNKLISVIIPIYNSEKYLTKSIESVINQSYSNLEIILINDGSTDNSISLCQKYMTRDKRVVFIDKANEGVSKSRNLGIDISHGQYLMFIDSDDYIDKNYIQDMFNYLEEKEFDAVISGANLVNDKGIIISENLYSKNNKQIYFDEIIEDIINTIYFCPCWKTLVSKDLIIDNNIKFNSNLKYGEDFMFSFNILKNANKIGYLSNRGYNYVQVSTSATHSWDYKSISKYCIDNSYIFKELLPYVGDKEYLIYNRIYTKFNLSMMRYSAFNNYRDFEKIANDTINLINIDNDFLEKVDISKIKYEQKFKIVLLLLLKMKMYFLYFIIVKMLNLLKKVLRK